MSCRFVEHRCCWCLMLLRVLALSPYNCRAWTCRHASNLFFASRQWRGVVLPSPRHLLAAMEDKAAIPTTAPEMNDSPSTLFLQAWNISSFDSSDDIESTGLSEACLRLERTSQLLPMGGENLRPLDLSSFNGLERLEYCSHETYQNLLGFLTQASLQKGKKRVPPWKQLQDIFKQSLDYKDSRTSSGSQVDSSTLAICALFVTLMVEPANNESVRSKRLIASAMAAFVPLHAQSSGRSMVTNLMTRLLSTCRLTDHALCLSSMTYFLQAFSKDGNNFDNEFARIVAEWLLPVFQQATTSSDEEEIKQDIKDALALYCLVSQPTNLVGDPALAVRASIVFGLWEGAASVAQVRPDVQRLAVELALDAQQFRLADAWATKWWWTAMDPDNSYFDAALLLRARLLHVQASLTKLIAQGKSTSQLSLLEQQVERVDDAVDYVLGRNDLADSDYASNKERIRHFAAERLFEAGQWEELQQLASDWGMKERLWDLLGIDRSWSWDELLKAAAQKRRDTYLQWEECLSSNTAVPDLIDDPQYLVATWDDFCLSARVDLPNGSSLEKLVFGFDAEWNSREEKNGRPGAAVLQLATLKQVLLLDMIALCSSRKGIEALRKTMGHLVSGRVHLQSGAVLEAELWGFDCKQDLAQLRATPGGSTFMPETSSRQSSGAMDLKQWLETRDRQRHGKKSSLFKDVGLSRITEHFLGKPRKFFRAVLDPFTADIYLSIMRNLHLQVDKSMQCSDWERRPLSEQQRIYASLDAWACAAVYAKALSA